MVYNPLSCSGWESTGTGWVASMPCLKARLGVVLLFFIIALIRKWGGEEMGLDFSFLMALVISIPLYFIVIIISGSPVWALIIGIIVSIIAGYGAGPFLGGSEY